MRRLTVLLGMVAIVAIAIGLIFWFQSSANRLLTPVRTPSASATPTWHHAVMPTANMHLLKQALNSPDIEEQSQALVVELRDEFVTQGQPILPPGTTVKLNPNTFLVYADNKSGQIEATTSIGQTFMLRLVLENGTWLVIYTQEK